MCNISSIKCIRAYGGMADTHVLGTCLARGESSSLSTPTRAVSIDTIDDTIATGLIRSRKKGVLVVQGSRQYVSLRNYHHTFFLSQVGNTIVITYLFLKNLSLHLCDSLVSNRIKTQRINHKCNKK